MTLFHRYHYVWAKEKAMHIFNFSSQIWLDRKSVSFINVINFQIKFIIISLFMFFKEIHKSKKQVKKKKLCNNITNIEGTCIQRFRSLSITLHAE